MSSVFPVLFAVTDSDLRQERRAGCKLLSFTDRYAFVGWIVLEKPTAILDSPVAIIAEGGLRNGLLRSKVNRFLVGSKDQREIVILEKKQTSLVASIRLSCPTKTAV
jgi:hypothetical protein